MYLHYMTYIHCTYYISSMQVKVTKRKLEHEEPVFLRQLKRGDYFGEKALQG